MSDYSGRERRKQVLTEEDREWIVATITSNHNCPFKEDDFKAVQKILDIHKTMGDGDLNRGIECFREHSRFMKTVLTKKSILAGAALVAVAGTIAVGSLWWLLESIRSWILTGGR